MKYKRNKQIIERGITLVALVVTIVVLLILAGITINLVLGENGLIQRTISTKDAHDIAKIKEELQLAIHALEVNYHTGNEQGTFRDYIFSTAQGKGQDKLKSELGASNLSFDSPNHRITYKGVIFSVAEDGTITVYGNGESANINWEAIMSTAQKHPDQSSSNNDIGLDANGNVVNLDLWVYDNYNDYEGIRLGDGDSCYGGSICYLPLGENGSEYPANIERTNLVCLQYVKLEGQDSFLPVVKLGNDAFHGCSTMQSIVIPDTVKLLGWSVFEGCSSLQSLVFPRKIESIYSDVFTGCNSLTNLSIEFEDEIDIVEYAFRGCERFCPHHWDMGYCRYCDTDCSHPAWNEGCCNVCGVRCEYTNYGEHSWNNGVCSKCGLVCNHDWDEIEGCCWTCGMYCEHPSWNNGRCTVCNVNCEDYQGGHYWNSENGICDRCGLHCEHTWESGYCSTCGMNCNHPNWSNGICTVCGLECADYYGHQWENGVCSNCGLHCNHYWDSSSGYCYECGMLCNHSHLTNGYCDVCGYNPEIGSN